MKKFDSKFFEQVKSKSDLVDVVGRYVRLERKGGDFWGRCPFHHEKTASFHVVSSEQFYHCFGCGASGDVIKFVSEMESVDRLEAAKILAEKAGIPIPDMNYDDDKIREQKRKKERLLALLKDVAYFYVGNLKSEKAHAHVEYILKRGMNTETVAKFGIGASLNFDDLPRFLSKKGYSLEEMTASGTVDVKDGRYYDALGGRLIIPIINPFGQVIAFGGRLLQKADFAKYKNTRETAIFSKSNTLYNLNNVKKIKNETGLNGVIIVEGYMDCISLVAAGITNVVASMGTSLTKDQARILKRYTDKVFISYDGDFAGQKASVRGLEILKDEGLEVKVVSMPDGLDPDDVIKKFGEKGYRQLLVAAMPLIDFKIDILKRTFDVNTVDGKRKFVSKAVEVIRESNSPAEQEDLLITVKSLTGVSMDALKRELYMEKTPKIVTGQTSENLRTTDTDKFLSAGRYVLAAYLSDKKYAWEEDLNDVEFSVPVHNEIKNLILEKKAESGTITFSDLFDVDIDHEEEKNAISETETESGFTEGAAYFSDCVNVLKKEKINSDIER
ncbi:MAG: DNA primase, partial [Clostridia bacterium]|nr:DNA primase [Clostridia bacterium]